jgi:hypothetical protein
MENKITTNNILIISLAYIGNIIDLIIDLKDQIDLLWPLQKLFSYGKA